MISQFDLSEADFSFSSLEFRVWIYEQLIFQRLFERAIAIVVARPYDRYRGLLVAKRHVMTRFGDFCFYFGALDIVLDQGW